VEWGGTFGGTGGGIWVLVPESSNYGVMLIKGIAEGSKGKTVLLH